MSFQDFQLTVLPVLERRGCNLAGDCHGGGLRGTFQLTPPDSTNPSFDFEQSVRQVFPYDAAASPLLAKPLRPEAGGTPHSFEPFASTSDPDYLAIFDWITTGEFQ